MALTEGVLGLVVERRSYAYAIADRYARQVGASQQVTRQAVAQALRRLSQRGYVREVMPDHDDPPPPTGGRRVIYEATEAGRRRWNAWLRDRVEDADRIQRELAVRIAFAEPDELERLEELFDSYEQACLAALASYSAVVRQGLADPEWSRALPALNDDRAVRRLGADLAWLRDTRVAMRVRAQAARNAARDEQQPRSAARGG